MRIRRAGFVATGIAVGALALSAVAVAPIEREVEEPWRLNWEERMSRRFSAAEQARRAEAYARRHRAELPAPERVLIDGATDPELFTASELFRQLVATAFASDPNVRASWRSLYEQKGFRDGQVPEEFWSRVEDAAAEMVRLEERRRKLLEQARSATPAEVVQLEARSPDPLTQCRVRHAALEAARLAFPSVEFDRFLYQAVAPHMSLSSTRNQAEIEYFEGGCR